MDRFQPREGTPAPYASHINYQWQAMERAFRAAFGDYLELSQDFYISGALITENPVGSSTQYQIAAGYICYKGEMCSVSAHSVTKTASQVVWLEVKDDPDDAFPVLNVDGNTDYVLRKRHVRLKVGPAYPVEYMEVNAPRKSDLDRRRFKGKIAPTGSIMPFYGDMNDFDGSGLGQESTPVEGWAICNGNNGTPDLRGMTIMGATSVPAVGAPDMYNGITNTTSPGDKVGADQVTLTPDQIPEHTHQYQDNIVDFTSGVNIGVEGPGSGGRPDLERTTEVNETDGDPIDVRQPSFALVFIMCLT